MEFLLRKRKNKNKKKKQIKIDKQVSAPVIMVALKVVVAVLADWLKWPNIICAVTGVIQNKKYFHTNFSIRK